MLEWVQELIFNVGYVGLGLLSFLENIFPPIPSEVIMPLGGFLVAQGRLSFVGVVLAGTLGTLLGALVLYALGRLFSQELLEQWATRYGRWLLLDAEDIAEAFGWFDRHGHKAIFVGRLVPAVRSLISIPAGSARMKLGPFLAYTAIGTVIWSSGLAYLGMLLGANYEVIGDYLGWIKYGVIAIVFLFGVWWMLRKIRRRRVA